MHALTGMRDGIYLRHSPVHRALTSQMQSSQTNVKKKCFTKIPKRPCIVLEQGVSSVVQVKNLDSVDILKISGIFRWILC